MKKLFLLAFAIVAVSVVHVTPAVASDEDFSNLMSAEEMAQDMAAAPADAEQGEEMAAAMAPGFRPRPPFPRPFPQPFPRPYPVVSCHAQNIRGQVFSATGYDPMFTQNQALANCQAFSLSCHALGCNYVF